MAIHPYIGRKDRASQAAEADLTFPAVFCLSCCKNESIARSLCCTCETRTQETRDRKWPECVSLLTVLTALSRGLGHPGQKIQARGLFHLWETPQH